MTMPQTRVTRVLTAVITPPFKGLSIAVWIYFVLCFLLQPNSQILHGDFPDPDDYLYLTQSIDLLHGQNWFDLVQHRMNPPTGTPIPFSHILCLFYAGFIYALAPLMGTIGAATVTAAFVPLFYFALTLMAIRWAARPFIEESWAGVTSYITIFATSLIFQFSPGHIEHHGLQVILSILAFGSSIRMIETPSLMQWPILTSFCLTLGVVTGPDMLPFLLLLATCLGGWVLIQVRQAANAGMLFGIALFLIHAGFLILTKAPAHLSDMNMPDYSIIDVILAGGIAICFTALRTASLLPWNSVRLFMGIICCATAGMVFFWHFPLLKGEMYGIRKFGFFELRFLWPYMSIAASSYFIWHEKWPTRRYWIFMAVFMIGLTGFSAFYKEQYLVFTEALCVLPLACLLKHGWIKISETYTGCNMCMAKLGLVLFVGPLPMVLLPALADGRPFNTGVLMFPNQLSYRPENDACDEHAIAQMLTLPAYYGDHPRVIMNMLDEGPQLLFRTPHKVLGIPYNTNSNSNDAWAFFTATDPHEAEGIARRHGAELVVMCKTLAPLYVPASGLRVELNTAGEMINGNPGFAQQLAEGTIPAWLKPITFPLLHDMMLFEVLSEQPISGNQ